MAISISYSHFCIANSNLVFLNEKKEIVKSFKFKELKDKFKVQNVRVYNYVSQEIEEYKTFDLSKILNNVYGQNQWKNSYALGTISTDNYAPIIRKEIFSRLKPYLAFDRADGKPFASKKSFSKKSILLQPYYIIWKTPKSLGNLKKVRDHWPWKVEKIFIFPKEPVELIPSDHKLNTGKTTFVNHCIACHSINGVGGTKGGELSDLLKETKLDEKQLQQYILKPRSINTASNMPNFPTFLDDKENRVKLLIWYIKDRIKNLAPGN